MTCQALAPLIPPSTSMIGSSPRASHSLRSARIFGTTEGRKLWPPKPGLTLINRMMSQRSSTSSICVSDVPGFSTTPATLPRSRIWDSVRCRWIVEPGSQCTSKWSAPACAKASRYRSGSTIIRCTSSGFAVTRRTASTTTGPIVRFGTKRPSITSTWIQSAPPAATARTSSPSREKSADRIDGATMIGAVIGNSRRRSGERPPLPAAAPQQLLGGVRPGGAGGVEFERHALVGAPHVEDRLHHGPASLDAVGALEQGRIADHAVIDQGLVAGARLGVEIVAIAEIHPHTAEMDD